MFYAIAIVLCIAAFCLMSRPLKWLYGLVFLLSLAYAYYVKFHTHTGFDEFQNLMRLLSLNLGLLAFGAILGLLREGADDTAHYHALRRSFLRFVCQWGAIYLLFTVVLTQLLSLMFGDDSAGFIIMTVAGKYLFAACVLIALIGRALARRSRED